MEQRKLGSTGPTVSALGLGCMGMSEVYGPADRGESIATVHAALDAGITLLDTGDFYAMGHNEMLVREALKDVSREKVQISVKFGALRGPAGEFAGMDTRPAATKNFLAYSLQRLGTDYIDVYRPARLDPNIPIEETIGGLADLVKAGYIRHIGLSEVGSDTIRRAHAVHPIADLQIEYSLIERGIERDILRTCRELGIGITAYGVLARGLISGHWSKDSGKTGRDYRLMTPALPGCKSRRQSRTGGAAPRHRHGDLRNAGAGRNRLGGGSRQGDRAAGRRTHPQPSHRSARCGEGNADAGASCGACKSIPARRRFRHALRGRADGASRQREAGDAVAAAIRCDGR
ncbi:aryl-alcohol dehydrogenase-like predicted oxidoreductase [Bradyrhizobium japonicum]